jgi:hypothetical protein
MKLLASKGGANCHIHSALRVICTPFHPRVAENLCFPTIGADREALTAAPPPVLTEPRSGLATVPPPGLR